MNIYKVHFKNKKSAHFYSFSYTEDESKYYFHKSEDRSDKDSFALKSEVTSIDNQGEPGPLVGGFSRDS